MISGVFASRSRDRWGIIPRMDDALCSRSGHRSLSVAGFGPSCRLSSSGSSLGSGSSSCRRPSLSRRLAVIGVFAVLALLESGRDKIPALDSVLDYVQTPLRIVAGALLSPRPCKKASSRGNPRARVGRRYRVAWCRSETILRPAANAALRGGFGVVSEPARGRGGALGRRHRRVRALVPLALVAFLLFFLFRVRRRRG